MAKERSSSKRGAGKREEPKREMAKREEPKREAAKRQEPKREAAKRQEPKREEPKPKREVAKLEAPKPQEPKPQEPKPQEPKPQEPKREDPKREEPKREDPKREEPKREEPKREEPKPEAARREEPRREAAKSRKREDVVQSKPMRLGIDFGTTHTVVAMVDRGNYPIVSFEHADFVPSLAAASDEGILRFGAQAAAVAHEPGWSVLRSFKRLLVDAGPDTELQLGPKRMKVLDLLVAFLAHLRDELRLRSNAHLRDTEPIEAAVSVPANASSAQRFLTVDAFRRAGFDVVALLNEPSSAGFEYAHRYRETVSSRREYVLVYDLGGGTFDASLIKMEGRANEVVTSSGVSRLGGDDFDAAILELALRKLGVEPTPQERLALLDECRVQKESLNPNTRRFVLDLAPLGRHDPLVLPIEEVYEACAPLVDQTVIAMEPAMRDPRREEKDVDWNELAGIYVVGGASSFPAVYRALRDRFGTHRVRRSPHPFGSTAIGLAITLDLGAGYTLAERLTRHFGVFREAERGSEVTFDVLIPKDARLPSSGEPPLIVTRNYRAAHNLGHFRFVECARVESGRPEGNLALWDEVLFPFDPGLRGRDLAQIPVARLHREGPRIEEIVRCGAEGELEVELKNLDDGYRSSVRIGRRGVA
jgi:actin-like ATPase involved in cell morphogenesis